MLFRRWCRGCDQTKLRAFISLDDERSGFISVADKLSMPQIYDQAKLTF